MDEFNWMSVHGWGSMGGSQLGTSRALPDGSQIEAVARTLQRRNIEGLLVIGGWSAYEAAHRLHLARDEYAALNIPIICMPAAIDNNLPGTEISIGADTALNSIVEVVDKIKQSAVATRRCFVVEVMGRQCGYLALMSGIATGAERAYLPEEGITLHDLEVDLANMKQNFRRGQRKSLMIRNERANPLYTAEFISALFEQESEGLFDVRQAILGHLQQGGDPSPFDRIQATRLAARCIAFLTRAGRKRLGDRRAHRDAERPRHNSRPGGYARTGRCGPHATAGAMVVGTAADRAADVATELTARPTRLSNANKATCYAIGRGLMTLVETILRCPGGIHGKEEEGEGRRSPQGRRGDEEQEKGR